MSARVALVSVGPRSGAARATVDSTLRAWPGVDITVLDLDGWYVPVATESVLGAVDVGLSPGDVHRRAARHGARALPHICLPELVTHLADGSRTAPLVALQPGVVLLSDPSGHWLTADAGSRSVPWPASEAVPVLVFDPQRDGAAREPRSAPALLGPTTLTPGTAISVQDDTLLVGGDVVVALDLSRADAGLPWLLDARPEAPLVTRLSEHAALAPLVARWLATMEQSSPGRRADGRGHHLDLERTSLDTEVDEVLHLLYAEADDAPDPFAPGERDALLEWLTGAETTAGPSRWLGALWRTRPDLQAAFADGLARDARGLMEWAATHGRSEGYPAVLLPAPATPPAVGLRTRLTRLRGRMSRPRVVRREPGVTVVGFLTAGFGLAESSRQLVAALRSAQVPCSTLPIEPAPGGVALAREIEPVTAREVSVLCVNADLASATSAVAAQVTRGSYRIGMWYWEVEEFPPSQHGGFASVDEVWVATDFIRAAIEPHSPVPVRTLTPPLPQATEAVPLSRHELGLPDRPLFLFTFDYLSTAERKNPWGLVEAFGRAFARDEGPVLVIKSINADRRPRDAERLRVAALGRPDVLLVEDYLPPAARDALVAHCDAYVSLHRAEGLGLTMAEAMALGKPVIATGYSGNLQFMTEENSFLVPWRPTSIPAHAAPYPAGGRWADPDLDEAARLMRLVLDDPATAHARGARAARDIATLHTPSVAGAAMASRLVELRLGR